MNRRRFLNFLVLGASAPSLLSSCRGSEELDYRATSLDPNDPFGSIVRRARSSKKPLLVIAIPEHMNLLSDHQLQLGYFFNHCDDEALFDLAHVEVVAATAAEMKTVASELPAYQDEFGGFMPMMWYLPAEVESPRAEAIGEEMPEMYEFGYQSDDDWDTQQEKFKASMAAWNDTLALKVRQKIWPSEEARAERAARPDRAAQIRAARIRLREMPPPGTVWANSSGCGCDIEGEVKDEEGMMIACGMAMIPAEASRFLQFYSAS